MGGTTSFWDFYAYVYDSIRHLLPYQELMQKTSESLNLKDGCVRVLDAGCGTGNFAEKFLSGAHTRASFYGTDRSRIMLKRAALKPAKDRRVLFLQSDMDGAIPFQDGSFDAVLCLNVLYGLDTPENTLRELRRVLRFGGRLIISNPRKNPKIRDVFISHLKLVFAEGLRRGAGVFLRTLLLTPCFTAVVLINLLIKARAARGQYHFFDERELRQMFERNGFRVLGYENVFGKTACFFVLTKIMPCPDLPEHTTVEIAETKEDFEAIYRLRYDVYCEEMRSLDPKDYPDKKEMDKYDAYSTHIILRLNGEIAGALRLIKNGPSGFLMEERFKLPDFIDRSKTVEHSRGVIKKEFRGKNIYSYLLNGAYNWQRERGLTTCIGAPGVDKLSLILLKRGWTEIGNKTLYHNTVVIPMICLL